MQLASYLKGLRNYALKRDKKIAAYIVWSIGLLFLILTVFVYFVPTTFIDIELSREIQEDQSPVLDFCMKVVSIFGINRVATGSIVLVAALCALHSYLREAFFVLTTSLASVINFGIKLLIQRSRPTADLVQIVEEAKNNSFPSGHTVHYVVFFGFLLVLMYRMKTMSIFLRVFISILSVSLIIAIPFSRMYLGAHWFTDVLAGFCLGILFLSALLHFYFKKPGKSDSLQTNVTNIST
jgi:undecaprenyl-diphosphatase